MNRDNLLGKIRALMSKTTSNGCSEAEALAALDKARAMMDAYEVIGHLPEPERKDAITVAIAIRILQSGRRIRYAAGQSAGERASFGRPVGGTSQERLT